MAKKRRRYDDKFRASAVILLEAAGYPDTEGALMKTSRHLNVPHTTLRRWFHRLNNPPPSELVQETKRDMSAEIESVIYLILGHMPEAVTDANFRDMSTSVGILIDKLQLLTNKPTAINEARSDSTRERLRDKLDSLAARNGAPNILDFTGTGGS